MLSVTIMLGNFPKGNVEELIWVVVIASVVILRSFGRAGVLRQKLSRELRAIACAPIPVRGDKRFKDWDPERIFPPGRWGYLLVSGPETKRSRPR